jgi:hypothetical protein
VKRYGTYRRKASRILIRYGQYGKNQVEEWKDMENMDETQVE